jgi:SH3-like domain-containing protein
MAILAIFGSSFYRNHLRTTDADTICNQAASGREYTRQTLRRSENVTRRRIFQVVLTALAMAFLFARHPATAAQDARTTLKTGASGLPVPRFVSLKSDRVNVRKGPSIEHSVAWVFSRAGLPVEVIAEFENWRQIRDSEGSEGWVFHALLSGRRTALVLPWVKERQAVVLLDAASSGADPVAQLEPGVLGSIYKCDGKWCNFSTGNYTGWIQQEKLWGVYRDEKLK